MRTRILMVTIGLALGALIWLPLRAILPAGIAATAVDGTIWNASLRGAEAGGLALGDVQLAAEPPALLGGNIRLGLQGPALQGEAVLGSGIDGLSASLLPLDATLPAQRITTSNLTLRFTAGQCTTATGQVEVITSLATLGGAPRCAGDAALVDLASPDGLITLRARIDAAGRLTLS
ncbi:hypothetical protein GCM10007973_20820 [Polymorphobacter multimanifer]|nr:hypothetical protein GCM10007973_20820 [Polymorphobacter multimanifer]